MGAGIREQGYRRRGIREGIGEKGYAGVRHICGNDWGNEN